MQVLRPVQEGLARDGRSTAIEGLRGAVVVSVIGYHLLRLLLTADGGSWGSTATAWWWWAGITRFGVDWFFVLAGVFVVRSWRASPSWRQYAVRRARRILPLFWVTAVAFGVPLVLWGGLSWERFGLHLSTQGYLDHRVPDLVNLPSWSMTTEVQFYVIAPLVAVAVRWWRGWPLLALTLVTSTWWIGWSGRGDIAASLLPGRLDQFVAGAVVGELVARGSDSRVRRLVARPHAGVVLLLVLLALGTWHGATFQQEAGGNGWLEDATHPIAGVLIAALVLRWLTGDAPRFLSWTPWRFLGMISFGLYLWHYPVLLYGLDWLGVRGDDASASGPVTLLVGVALVAIAVALATASYTLVETRFCGNRRTGSPDSRKVLSPLPVAATAAS